MGSYEETIRSGLKGCCISELHAACRDGLRLCAKGDPGAVETFFSIKATVFTAGERPRVVAIVSFLGRLSVIAYIRGGFMLPSGGKRVCFGGKFEVPSKTPPATLGGFPPLGYRRRVFPGALQYYAH